MRFQRRPGTSGSTVHMGATRPLGPSGTEASTCGFVWFRAVSSRAVSASLLNSAHKSSAIPRPPHIQPATHGSRERLAVSVPLVARRSTTTPVRSRRPSRCLRFASHMVRTWPAVEIARDLQRRCRSASASRLARSRTARPQCLTPPGPHALHAGSIAAAAQLALRRPLPAAARDNLAWSLPGSTARASASPARACPAMRLLRTRLCPRSLRRAARWLRRGGRSAGTPPAACTPPHEAEPRVKTPSAPSAYTHVAPAGPNWPYCVALFACAVCPRVPSWSVMQLMC